MADKPENKRATRATNSHPEPPDTSSSQTPNTSARTESNSTPPSLASRVQSSAAGLARSAFQPSSATELAQTLASGTNGKAAGSSSATSVNTQHTASRDGSAAARSSRTSQTGTGPGPAESFRSASCSAAGQGETVLPLLTEEAFLRGDTDAGIGIERDGASLDTLQSETGNWKGKQRAQDPVQMEFDTVWRRGDSVSETPAPTADTQSESLADGAAVVSLLSDTSFDPFATEPENAEDLNLDLDPAAPPPPLTASEIEMLDSFRRQLPPSTQETPTHQAQYQHQPRLTAQSLVPDIDTFLAENDPSATSNRNGHTATGISNQATTTDPATISSLRDSVLTHLPGATDWLNVHERYHDEVWGYLRPVLEAARIEIEEKEKETGREHEGDDGPAVRRLKMILAHMRVQV
ncbi:hypothetical protein NUU61_000206 [Penicillium alfredii]|uniref:Uncharacterized protein n=1 Tax=Penicillium alfredii TaxID=1506179 RepID=A0A9W9G9G1_9EURO|nr:uncharacterized protein NUU61_000206 [Penicillium alfredii]KAJ5114447.1 hypothetical protein NUU61_000206 [Penicillium alfredii]